MIQTVSIEDLHNRIDELLDLVKNANDEIILSSRGTPVARLLPLGSEKHPLKQRVPGSAHGDFVVPDDFNDPLPDEIVDAFYQ